MTGCMDVTMEVSNTKWPSASTLDGFWDDNRQSLLNYIAGGPLRRQRRGHRIGLRPASGRDDHGDRQREMPVHTDPAHGDYYKLLDSGTYDLNFSADGYISQTITGVSTAWGTPTVQDVVLNPVAHGDVAGTVKDLGGAGLDAQVNFFTIPLGNYVTTVVASAGTGGSLQCQPGLR